MKMTEEGMYRKRLKEYLISKRSVIDEHLRHCIKEHTFPGRLSDAMQYAVMAGGKRLRPVLCIAAAEAVSASATDLVLTAGCAIELIHTYSLIHDDLPAMDDDVLRRGNATCHVKFDEATAILAGDALLTLAFEILSNKAVAASIENRIVLQLVNIISKASGARGMVEGQMRDMLAEGRHIPVETLEQLHGLKTGALIRASVESGAILGGAEPIQLEHLNRYARDLGLAFQVTDDLLNIEGDPEIMGKSTGTDAEKNKSTYPSLLGVKASREKARQLLDSALQALDIFDTKANPLRDIAMYVIQRDR